MADKGVLAELPEGELNILEGLLEDSTPGEFEIYLEKAAAHLRETREAAEAGSDLDVATAERIMDLLYKIENIWDDFEQEDQRLICAAVRYFARSFDEVPDLCCSIGFDDDANVINACLRAVGREDLAVL